MKPGAVGRNDDRMAEQWNSNAFARHNGIEPHAPRLWRGSGAALDIGCGCSGRSFELLAGYGPA